LEKKDLDKDTVKIHLDAHKRVGSKTESEGCCESEDLFPSAEEGEVKDRQNVWHFSPATMHQCPIWYNVKWIIYGPTGIGEDKWDVSYEFRTAPKRSTYHEKIIVGKENANNYVKELKRKLTK
jgi:hypothetical protein